MNRVLSAAPRGRRPADARRFRRRAIERIEGALRTPGDVTVFDLSLSGLSFQTAHEIEVGQHCFLELRHRGSTANVEVCAKWVEVEVLPVGGGEMREIYRVGASFVDIERDEAAGIWSWIHSEGDEDSGGS